MDSDSSVIKNAMRVGKFLATIRQIQAATYLEYANATELDLLSKVQETVQEMQFFTVKQYSFVHGLRHQLKLMQRQANRRNNGNLLAMEKQAPGKQTSVLHLRTGVRNGPRSKRLSDQPVDEFDLRVQTRLLRASLR